MSHFLCLLYSKKINWIWVTLHSYNTWPIYELFQHLCLLTDALSGACAGSLLEKIPYAEEKKIRCMGFDLWTLPSLNKSVTIWAVIIRQLHQNLTTLKKLLKSKLPIIAIFERLCIEKKVRQIFSVFSTCSFLILMCEIDPGCKQMLFLEHAQSDE